MRVNSTNGTSGCLCENLFFGSIGIIEPSFSSSRSSSVEKQRLELSLVDLSVRVCGPGIRKYTESIQTVVQLLSAVSFSISFAIVSLLSIIRSKLD